MVGGGLVSVLVRGDVGVVKGYYFDAKEELLH